MLASTEMTSTKYNGWTNRATWNLALWVFNDQDIYEHMRGRFSRQEPAEHNVEHFCRSMYGDQTPDKCNLDEVNWMEITAAFDEDLKN